MHPKCGILSESGYDSNSRILLKYVLNLLKYVLNAF